MRINLRQYDNGARFFPVSRLFFSWDDCRKSAW